MAYTQEELVSIINTYIIDNNILAINPAKMREVLIAIATSINTGGSSSPTARAPIFYDPFSNTFTFRSLGVIAEGTDEYTATVEGLTSLETGYYFLATFKNPNTGVARMNLNGLSDDPILKNYDTPVAAGDLTGSMWLVYDGANWVVVGSVGSGGGVAAVWGSITGTLSAQTDLQSALNAKQAALTETVLGALINGLTAKTTLVDADLTDIVDSADSNKSKKITWLNVWSYIKSKADTFYASKTFTESISFQDSNTSIVAQTYVLELYANYAYTINELKVISDLGTCTVAVKINGTNVTGISAVSVSTTIATGTATAANTVAIGDKITLVVTSPTTLNNLQATLKTTRI